MENKSKFGLAAGLMGAFVYLACGFSGIILVIMLIAVALWEENEFVKISVKRAAVLYIAYQAVCLALDVILKFIGLFSHGFIYSLFSKIDSIVSVAYIVLILFFAIKSLINPTVTESVLDKTAVDKVTEVAANVASNVAAKVPAKKETKKCPKCGKEVEADSAFCTSCGEKFEEKAE